jgi:D-beta-D-heptose 7-phosphate kinase/D-beta-D-heptose 1-phosphate adenosyltransferase
VRGGRLVARVDDDHDSDPVMPPPVIVGPKPAAVIVTDYGRGAVTKESAAEWAAFCRKFNVPMFADPKKGRTGVWGGDTDLAALVLNWDEACEMWGGSADVDDADEAVRIAGNILRRRPQFGRVVVKRGVYGSVLVTHGGGRHEHVPPVLPRHQVADRQGAGDTYIAALAAGIARGLEMPLACLLGSAAAGVAVSRPGTAVVGLRDALEALKPVLPPDLSPKDLRTMGYEVGYTNGCFDFHLHPGHLSTLAHAASLCDFLFVGVDSDARVLRLKGDGRPVVPARDRVAQLQACKGVYRAFEFEDHEEALRSVYKAGSGSN